MKTWMMAAVAAVALVGSAWAADQKILDIRPAAETVAESPTSTDWEAKNKSELLAATDEAVLAGFVVDDAAARALCAAVKPNYATDPMRAVQIAAVTQYVMRPGCKCPFARLAFWRQSQCSQRKIWVAALLDRAVNAKEPDVQIFFLDQLRWCGCAACCLESVKKIGETTGDVHVRDMVNLVVRELEKR